MALCLSVDSLVGAGTMQGLHEPVRDKTMLLETKNSSAMDALVPPSYGVSSHPLTSMEPGAPATLLSQQQDQCHATRLVQHQLASLRTKLHMTSISSV